MTNTIFGTYNLAMTYSLISNDDKYLSDNEYDWNHFSILLNWLRNYTNAGICGWLTDYENENQYCLSCSNDCKKVFDNERNRISSLYCKCADSPLPSFVVRFEK